MALRLRQVAGEQAGHGADVAEVQRQLDPVQVAAAGTDQQFLHAARAYPEGPGVMPDVQHGAHQFRQRGDVAMVEAHLGDAGDQQRRAFGQIDALTGPQAGRERQHQRTGVDVPVGAPAHVPGELGGQVLGDAVDPVQAVGQLVVHAQPFGVAGREPFHFGDEACADPVRDVLLTSATPVAGAGYGDAEACRDGAVGRPRPMAGLQITDLLQNADQDGVAALRQRDVVHAAA
ncbi:MAG: hypothetical protein U5K81_02250 [Trueperaceae bacterium]|nr:hypothetical protein [Trueperaceae bacterium]